MGFGIVLKAAGDFEIFSMIESFGPKIFTAHHLEEMAKLEIEYEDIRFISL